ncbi:MAG: hypothetical protein ACUZ8I_15235 [Candidatus Scalindua sp.]
MTLYITERKGRLWLKAKEKGDKGIHRRDAPRTEGAEDKKERKRKKKEIFENI